MFAYKSGMKLISASSDVNITALKTSIHVLAKTDITLTTNTIALIAKKQVLVNGGGSYMQWSAGSIEEGTAGTRVAHAGTHPVAGPDNMPVPAVVLPSGTPRELDPKSDLSFTLLRHAGDGRPVPNEPYVLYKDGAAIAKGVTDENGRVVIKDHKASVKQYEIELFNKGKYHLTVVEGYASLDQKVAAQGFRAAFDDEGLRLQEYLQSQSEGVA
jgi:type VI secretion system secreted protein VgrG